MAEVLRQAPRPQVIRVPLVIQSAWDDGRGNVGLFAVNTQRQEAVLKIPAPGAGKWQAAFFTGSRQERTQTLASGETLEWHLSPGRLQAVIIRVGM